MPGGEREAVTDYHVITPEAAELVMQVVDGQVVIVPPATPEPAPGVAPVPPASGR